MTQILNFYKSVESLINLILTGEEKKTAYQDFIELKSDFLISINNPKDHAFNSYFLHSIQLFLVNCNVDDRKNLVEVLRENDRMLSGAYILTMVKEKVGTSQEDHFADKFQNMMHNFIVGKKVHFTICLALYFYIENISKIKVKDKRISVGTYEELIRFNSVKRN